MTSLDAVGRLSTIPDGLSAFDPGRDLTDVVALLELGFGEDLDPRDRQWLADLTSLAELTGPMLGWVVRLIPPLASSLSGYVWHVDGRLVANASLMRGGRGVWALANVVTRPEHRRAGIATALVEAALADARAGGARELHLQVRDDNEPAQRLYGRLGFRKLHATTWMELASPRDLRAVAPVPGAMGVSGWRLADRAEIKRMLRRADPGLVALPAAVREAAERPAWRWALDGLTGGMSRYAIADGPHRAIRAVGVTQGASASAPHRLALVTDPEWRGLVEAALIEALVRALPIRSEGPALVELDTRESGAVTALEGRGFVKKRTLERLALRFR